LTIALDATYSLGDALSGVGLYSREILMGLAAAHPEARFHFYYRPHRFLQARRDPLPSNVRRRLLAGPLGPRRAALFHGLNQRLPEVIALRSVATFHDLFVLTGEYSTPEFRERFAAQARDAAARASAIIAVSEFTKRQVVSLLGVAAEKVRVVHHGTRQLAGALGCPVGPVSSGVPSGVPADPGAGPSGRIGGHPSGQFSGQFTGHLGVAREKIVLNVGTIQKRKNIARLVEAFETVDNSWSLVLVGSAGYGAEEILARIERSPASARIAVTGYVTPESLAGWYSRAMVFAFPSLDEGFGMPVLEAMASGIPVLTSSRSALPEVAGDAAWLVDPEDTEALAQALRSMTERPELREDLARRGVLRARRFTWEKAVRETWDVYEEVLR
jgi:glycosyltransferase involved in cell wall biosynthesis